MAVFTLCVQDAPALSHRSNLALRFARAAVAAGHRIQLVFFYQAGALHANTLATLPADEPDVATDWLAFSRQHQVPLEVCQTVASRFGVVTRDELASTPEQTANFAEGYTSAGLTDFITALSSSDKVVQF